MGSIILTCFWILITGRLFPFERRHKAFLYVWIDISCVTVFHETCGAGAAAHLTVMNGGGQP
jgi:hypothetical protein